MNPLLKAEQWINQQRLMEAAFLGLAPRKVLVEGTQTHSTEPGSSGDFPPGELKLLNPKPIQERE